MSKILIIGQAPPAVKQEIPYDTTMLYDIFSWVGITKEQAQDMFEFEACIGYFPGYENDSHKKPEYGKMLLHYTHVIQYKLGLYDKVILLGKVAEEFYSQPDIRNLYPMKKWLPLIHPSKRNYSRIMKDKDKIVFQLSKFINPHIIVPKQH